MNEVTIVATGRGVKIAKKTLFTFSHACETAGEANEMARDIADRLVNEGRLARLAAHVAAYAEMAEMGTDEVWDMWDDDELALSERVPFSR